MENMLFAGRDNYQRPDVSRLDIAAEDGFAASAQDVSEKDFDWYD